MRTTPCWLRRTSPCSTSAARSRSTRLHDRSRPLALGVSARGSCACCVDRALIRPVLRGTYVAAQAPDTVDLRAAALRLVVPETAVVTDRTAAWLHGVDILPRSAVHAPPPPVRVRQHGVAGASPRGGERHPHAAERRRHGRPRRARHHAAADGARPRPPAVALRRARGPRRVPAHRRAARRTSSLSVERFTGQRGVVQLRFLAPLGGPARRVAGRVGAAPALVRRRACRGPNCSGGSSTTTASRSSGWTSPCRRSASRRSTTAAGFHDEHDEQRGARRRAPRWLDRARGWLIEVFDKDDVYAQRADPARGCRRGSLRTARSSVCGLQSGAAESTFGAAWSARSGPARAQPESARSDRSAGWECPQVTGRLRGGRRRRGRGTRWSPRGRRHRRRGCRGGRRRRGRGRPPAALPSPLTRNHTDRGAVERGEGEADPLRGRLGGVGDADGDPVVDVERPGGRGTARRRARPGRRRASRSRTRRCRARAAASAYAAAASSTSAASSRRRHLVHVGRVHADASRNAARAWPALRSGSSAATNRSSPHQTHHPRPVHARTTAASRATSRCTASAMVPPVSTICGHLAARPGRRRAGRAARRPRRWPARRRRRGPRSAASVTTAPASSRQPARGGGVHVVLVEAAQLLGEQLGQVAPLERDRPVGLAGGGERREPAVGRGRSGSAPPWSPAPPR